MVEPAAPAARHRPLHGALLAAGAQRAALLPHGDRPHRRDHAADLHADGGRGVPRVLAHRARAEGLLHHARRPRADREDPRQLARAGHPRHRRHRRAAHPRPRRPRRQRHGDSRSASSRSTPPAPGIPPRALPAGDARRGHEQRGAARRRCSTSAIRTAASTARRTSRSSTSSCEAVQKKYPNALIQFEDFLTPDAYALLARLSRPRALLQRRHPGHRGGGARRRLRVDADHRSAFRDLCASCSSAPARPRPASPT